MDPMLPQRLFKNIPGQDRAASGGRQAASERILSDNKPFHLIRVGFGHVSRASDRVQAGDVRVGYIEGSPRLARRLLGDNVSENAEGLFKRRAIDRRLERFLLPAHPLLISQQRFLGPGVLDRDPYPLPVQCQASSPRGYTRPLARDAPLYWCMANPEPRVSSIFRSPAVVEPL